ncbi:MAG: type II secretion system F family protein [Eubacteriales bacterium]
MAVYVYKARDKYGKLISGEFEAAGKQNLIDRLRDEGLYLITGAEKRKSIDITLSKKLTPKDLTVFCRQLSVMMSAGVTIVKALDILYKQTSKKTPKKIIRTIYEDVQRGELFSNALRRQKGIFPEIMLSMVDSGEASGTLDTVMAKLATYFENDLKIRNKIKTAMIYPTVLFVLMIAVVIIMMSFVLPAFTNMFEDAGAQLPQITKVMMSISGFMASYWYIVVLSMLLLVFSIRYYSKTEKGQLVSSKILLKLPVIGKTQMKISVARFCRNMSTLFESGTQVLTSLDIVSRIITNKVISEEVLNIREDVKRGMSISHSVSRSDMLPTMLASMVSIGEESGSLDKMLAHTADYYDNEVELSIQQMIGILEPAIIIIMAFLVGFIILSVMIPMMSIFETVGAM